jgi:hypothetical protein
MEPDNSDKPVSSLFGIELGELSRPATVFVERISDAIEGIAKPWQIVRVAKAEAKARRIEGESEIEISDLQRRALRRVLRQEERKQRNIENITKRALPQLKEHADPSRVDDDWITHFFDTCGKVSDEQMQELWSRVLAGEANGPGTFSKRAVSLLATLDSEEAELFTCFRYLLWQGSQGQFFIIESAAIPKFWKFTFHFQAAKHHLQSIGLLDNNMVTYSVSKLLDMKFQYFDETYKFVRRAEIVPPPFGLELIGGLTHLTAIGYQLMRLVERKRFMGYAEAVMQEQATELKLGFEQIADKNQSA